VAPSSVLSIYCDKICLKFASHDFLLYAIYICQIIKFYLGIQMLPANCN